MPDDPKPLDLADLLVDRHDPMRLEAYYYSFVGVGIPAIDRILSAVACAGKGYHNTSQWYERLEGEPYEPFLRGDTFVAQIDNAADDAGKAVRALLDRLESAETERDNLIAVIDAERGYGHGLTPADAVRDIARKYRELLRTYEVLDHHYGEAETERDRALARVGELERVAGEACDVAAKAHGIIMSGMRATKADIGDRIAALRTQLASPPSAERALGRPEGL
jgi:hypothetical protein